IGADAEIIRVPLYGQCVTRSVRCNSSILASSRGTYCTAGYFASLSVSAWVVSAMTVSPTLTRTRLGLAVMVIGWSGPGSFIAFALLLNGFVWPILRRQL